MKSRQNLLAAICTAAVMLAPASALAKDESLPQDQLIAAIKTAVAAHPGNVHQVEVERKLGGEVVVEVDIVDANGKKREVRVDPAKNLVLP